MENSIFEQIMFWSKERNVDSDKGYCISIRLLNETSLYQGLLFDTLEYIYNIYPIGEIELMYEYKSEFDKVVSFLYSKGWIN